jgi:hypothetical protein
MNQNLTPNRLSVHGEAENCSPHSIYFLGGHGASCPYTHNPHITLDSPSLYTETRKRLGG